MSLDAEAIIRVMEKAKELGFTEIRVEGLEAKISNVVHTHVPELKPEEILKPMSVLDEYSDDELLYFATPYFEELQAQKMEHQKKLNEETEKRA